MKKIRVATVLFVGAATLSPHLYSQNTAKPSPYTGVSQPPPDDTITSDDPAPAAKLIPRPAPSAAAATPAVAISSTPAPSAPQAALNPDYGIVGDSPFEGAAETSSTLPAKPTPTVDPNLDADIVTSMPGRPGELPSGTLLHMALNQEISSQETQPGSDFSGRVAADVVSSGRVVIPQGSEVLGKVLRVSEGHRFGEPATVHLRPDVVVLPDGSRYVVRAQIVDTAGKSRIDGEGSLVPKSRRRNNALKEGAGIGTGAVAGAILGGPPGALVGSIIGAGVMTTHILVQSPATVRVPKDSNLTLSLMEPMLIIPAQGSEQGAQ